MAKRTHALTAAVLTALLLTGFAFGEVKLRIDHPLIDLSETVRRTEAGDADTLREADGAQAQETQTPAQNTVSEAAGQGIREASFSAVSTIRVREQQIFLDDVLYGRPETIRHKLAAIHADAQARGVPAPRIVLVDDYADYQTYTDMQKLLSEAGYPFTEESGE